MADDEMQSLAELQKQATSLANELRDEVNAFDSASFSEGVMLGIELERQKIRIDNSAGFLSLGIVKSKLGNFFGISKQQAIEELEEQVEESRQLFQEFQSLLQKSVKAD